MKKLLVYSVLFCSVALLFDGCKKGPEDPFLSFKSRKKRVEGYWKVVKYLDNNVDSTTLVKSYYDENTGDPCGKVTETTTREWIIRFHFDEDGRYEKDSVINYRYAIGFENETPTQTRPISFDMPTSPSTTHNAVIKCENHDSLYVDLKTITKGFWMFAGATGDVKNKERLFLTDGEDQFDGFSYDIIECREKSMKLVFSVSNPDGTVRKIQYNMEPTDPFDEND